MAEFGSEIKNNSNSIEKCEFLRQLAEHKPQLKNTIDAIGIALHFIFRQMQFKCIGVHDKLDSNANTIVPPGWNSSSELYSFQYKHPKSSMTFMLKILLMGEKLLVNGVAQGDNNIQSIEVPVKDYVVENVKLEDFDNLYKNFDQLVKIFQTGVVNKLLPMSEKDLQEQQQQPSTQTRRNQPLRELDYDYDDYDPLRVPQHGARRGVFPPPLFGVGSDDLNPIPTPFGSGNLIGPAHPGFGPNVTNPYADFPQPNANQPRGRGGPPRSHPPGARFDPFGPPIGDFSQPDNDDFPPPGNMYL